MNQIENIARGVCIHDGKILLAYFKEKSYYFLPGGHVEFGESILTTLEREMMEETGLVAHAKDVVLVFEHTWENKGRTVHEMNYILTYDLESAPTSVPSTVEHLEFVWASPEQFDAAVFLPKEIKNHVSKILEGNSALHFFSTMRS